MVWFKSWSDIVRVVVLSVVGYAALLFLIRAFGKRTISRMNPGDFVITVAIGSIVASMILFTEVPIANGLAALVAMVLLQFTVEWATARSPTLRRLVDGSPTLLLLNGKLLRHNMRRENVDEEDILEALRTRGVTSIKDAGAVVLEIDGSFSVLTGTVAREDSALQDVRPSAVNPIRREPM